ncbi:MAG: PQQ-dependent sugar dehydrogenase [Candidatus Magasanikiibacteriota bacterium]
MGKKTWLTILGIIILATVYALWPKSNKPLELTTNVDSTKNPPTPPAFAIETVAKGLNVPVAAAFTPDGRILVTEKAGDVKIIKDNVLLSTPAIILKNLNFESDRGLLGIAVDPDFSNNGYIYLSYTYENNPADPNGPKTGRIARYTMTGDIANPTSEKILVGTIVGDPTHPSCNDFPMGSDCIPSDAGSHSVGGLRFGPDGKLYASLADAARFDIADPNAMNVQNLDSLAGKIIRINSDGTAPSDNPFFNGNPNANRSKVYTYGFRNPLRTNFRPLNQALYIGEVGWFDTEEIDLGIRGANYGWPCREGLSPQPNYNCTIENYTDPLVPVDNEHTATSTFALIGGTFSGAAYPEPYQDNYFFGIFGKDELMRAVFDKDNKIITPPHIFLTGTAGAVDFITGPDGSVYFVSIFTGELRRLTYNLNRPPQILIDAKPTTGSAPLEVQFLSDGTIDPQGYEINYLWNFGDNTTSTLANPKHTFTADQTYTVTLTAVNSQNAKSQKQLVFKLGEPLPTGNGSLPQLLKIVTTPTNIYAANQMTVNATVGNSGTSDPMLINIEIYDENGKKLTQQFFDNTVIENNHQTDFTLGWIPQFAGDYYISVGFYTAGWGELKQWINKAAEFSVGNRAPD